MIRRSVRRDTTPERALRQQLHRLGMRFLVDVSAPGTSRRRRVDVLVRGSRLAVLVHGCFWHGCPEHYHPPRANAGWWALKLRSVQERDADTLDRLRDAGWLPLVVWEHEDMATAAARIRAVDDLRRRWRTVTSSSARPRPAGRMSPGPAAALVLCGQQHDGGGCG